VEELEPILRAAAAALEGFEAQPRAEFQRAAKSRFINAVAAVREEPVGRGSWFARWRRGWAMAVVLVLGVLVMGGGTVGASTNSLPGDALYPVKRAAESVQAFFTFGNEARANLYIKYGERRVAEIEALATRGREVPESVLSGMDRHTNRALDLAAENGSFRTEVIRRLIDLTNSEWEVLSRIAETAPARVQVVLRDALQRSERANARALRIGGATDPQPAPSLQGETGEEGGTESEGAGGVREPAQEESPASEADVEAEPGGSSSSGDTTDEAWPEEWAPSGGGASDDEADVPGGGWQPNVGPGPSQPPEALPPVPSVQPTSPPSSPPSSPPPPWNGSGISPSK
jgi:hypothetical protein